MLYIGVTGDMARRLAEHRLGTHGFASRYHVTTLVYLEPYNDIRHAIVREKQLKGWKRTKKIALIHSQNPTWRDLPH